MTKFSVYIGIDWANDKHDVCVQVANGDKKRRRQSKMTTSECMTIVSAFHQSNHRDFKNFYIGLVRKYWGEHFPILLSSTRFLHKMSALIIPMCVLIFKP
jgi:hypothetical protein